MIPEDLKPYVIERLKEGLNADEIWSSIIDSGRSKEDVHEVFEDREIKGLILEKEGLPPVPPEGEEREDDLEESQEIDFGDIDTSVIESIPVPPGTSKDLEFLPDIKKYVIKSLKLGFSKNIIKDVAIEAGWKESDVDKVFADEDVSSLMFKNRVN